MRRHMIRSCMVSELGYMALFDIGLCAHKLETIQAIV